MSRRFPVRGLGLMALLLAAACGGGAGGGRASGGGLEATLIVHPPEAGNAEGPRRAVVQVVPAVAVKDVVIRFQVPADCRVVAGAAVRTFPALEAGRTQEHGILFGCQQPTGSVKVAVTGTNAEGQPVSRDIEARY